MQRQYEILLDEIQHTYEALQMRTTDWCTTMVLLLTGKTTIRNYPQGETGSIHETMMTI